MKFVALVAIVPEEREEEAVGLAKNAGAGAVTILRGRNLGLKEKKIFFGLTLEENVSLLLFVLPRRISMRVLKALVNEMDMQNDENSSLAFTVPVGHVAGLNIEVLHKFEDEIKNLL
ncbi:transcriptional regulator [Hydrogenimonas cancrithermarum]|uniref:Nitrogen regulatory protein P-II n=1 Tax=Hydrogenimonas cancrithermarum TaxID=2993563 RepID=A0ABM8FMT8_9BACT|nr:transcriptional regulator [Hydrogenimonas cancrithermarum]BDY13696.1 nitrogen regulatory protein P-II [Hydrogenimonas cancrithermarum]